VCINLVCYNSLFADFSHKTRKININLNTLTPSTMHVIEINAQLYSAFRLVDCYLSCAPRKSTNNDVAIYSCILLCTCVYNGFFSFQFSDVWNTFKFFCPKTFSSEIYDLRNKWFCQIFSKCD
jgi:hypothetical protein